MAQDHPRWAPNVSRGSDQDYTQDTLDRITVAQAAERLGVSKDAVRKRIARGTIRHDKDPGGRIFVYLDAFERASKTVQDESREEPSKTVQDEDQDKYTRSLEDQIEFLRRELERKDTIIMSLTQRIPELEPSPETRDAPDTSTEGKPGTETPDEATGQERPSWWRRFFGFE